jgi:ATP-dependent Lon protease
MTKDTQSKIYRSPKTKASKKREEDTKLKKRNNESSDSDRDSDNSDSENEDFDMQEYHKFLAKTFPSKHMNKKVDAGKKLKKVLKRDLQRKEEESDDEEESEQEVKKKRFPKKLPQKNKKQIVSESEEEYIEDYDNDDDDEEYIPKKNKKTVSKKTKRVETEEDTEDDSNEDESEDDSDDEEEDENESEEDDENDKKVTKKVKGKSGKFNIIFTIGGKKGDEYEDDDEDYDEEDDEEEWLTCSEENETENEDDPISSDEDEEEEEEDKVVRSKKQTKITKTDKSKDPEKETSKNTTTTTDQNEKETKPEESSVKESEKIDTNNILEVLKGLQNKSKDNEIVTECIKMCENKISISKKKNEKKQKKIKDRNNRIFKRILRDKNTMNDFEFFEKLESEQQKKIIKELREINKITRVEKPYRLTLLESDIPLIFKSAALKKISTLRYMEPGSGEFYKIKNWVDTFMRIPFGNYKNLPISIDDGVDKCHDFMANAQKTLDDAVYGLNDAKMQIMQMLGQLITNPKSIGTAIAIHGPPGTGKTSIVKEGISKILNRPFAFIALGGATDSSFLEGHGYTYEGSTWGKIVQILIDSKCMNPVIYFDELDKISDTPKGEEITGILTHLTDTAQNSQFHDKYFTEIDFDLSKCLFIFSYNDESKVNPILKDRMYRIQTKGYNQKQKTVIANSHLLPKIQDQVRFKTEDIIIPDEVLHYIIDNFCNKEDGVRNLKRCLEIIYTKLNLYRLMRPGSNLFEEDMSLKVEFPFTVSKVIVDKLIKNTKENISALHSIYV